MLIEIAPILARLATESAADAKAFPMPEELQVETRIAMQDKALHVGVRELGEPSMFACPECHGVLLRRKAADARGRAELVRRAVMEHETMSEETLSEAPREPT